MCFFSLGCCEQRSRTAALLPNEKSSRLQPNGILFRQAARECFFQPASSGLVFVVPGEAGHRDNAELDGTIQAIQSSMTDCSCTIP